MSPLRLGGGAVRSRRPGPRYPPHDEDFDRDRSDRRLIGWAGWGLVALCVTFVVIRLWR
jgi:hypothetical protein